MFCVLCVQFMEKIFSGGCVVNYKFSGLWWNVFWTSASREGLEVEVYLQQDVVRDTSFIQSTVSTSTCIAKYAFRGERKIKYYVDAMAGCDRAVWY